MIIKEKNFILLYDMAHDSIIIIITEIIITIIIYYIQQSELYYVVKKGLETISLNYFQTY